MSYSKTTWKTGDTITAQLLNHAEDGIAANDAAIAAIPAGLQLYGPYFANGSATVQAGDVESVTCNTMEDVNGDGVTFPDVASGAITFAASAGADDLIMAGYTVPSIGIDQNLDPTWYPGSMSVYNSTAESVETECSIKFYSTVEFPASQA